jgi:BlaI family transcriptional regulator, penicillinase repressor
MAEKKPPQLSRRERQIMEIVYGLRSASAADVLERLPDPPSYSAVRAMLRILEDKGQLTHRADGPRYVYSPVVPRTAARQSALRQLVKTFFDGSSTQAVAALLDMSESQLSADEAEQLAALIEKAKREGK